jgi:hypothetical protein
MSAPVPSCCGRRPSRSCHRRPSDLLRERRQPAPPTSDQRDRQAGPRDPPGADRQDMASPMTRQLWSAVEILADAWRRTDVARGYAEVFIDPQHALSRRLREILSSYGGFEKQKLLLARVLQVIPEYAGFSREPGGAEFLQRGEQLGTAFLWTLEWWRSRLPAYPMMPAPQLVRDGPLSTQELTFRVPWPDELRRQGLQLTSAPPPIVADLLGTTPPSLDEAARAVGAALASCPQVRELEQAQAALTDDGRAALSNARDRARKALRPAQIDAAAGDLALDRLAYREALVADAVDSLVARQPSVVG